MSLIAGRVQSTDTAPYTAIEDKSQPSEEEQRRKIMAHASMANSTKRSRLSPDAEAVPTSSSAPVDKDAEDQPNSSEDAAKQAIMQHATQLHANNSMLAQLHAERLARQQLGKARQDVKQKTQPARQLTKSDDQPIAELKLLTYNVW